MNAQWTAPFPRSTLGCRKTALQESRRDETHEGADEGEQYGDREAGGRSVSLGVAVGKKTVTGKWGW